ncbi:MAG: DNA repair protein RecN [Acidimicrobiales bacterium]
MMLVELAIRDLGLIEDLHLVLEPGVTAITGETGTGKTLVVGSIELLVGGRAEAMLVREGAEEARIEGRFAGPDGVEQVLARVVPRSGRSRAYVDSRLATVAELAERGRGLVDLHGQHEHQSLLGAGAQRRALDHFARVDLSAWEAAKARRDDLAADLGRLGGDAGARERETDLLRYQVEELDQARLIEPDEERLLEADEDRLADAAAHRAAAAGALALIVDDDGPATGDRGGADARLRGAIAALGGRGPFGDIEERLRTLAIELDDLAADLRVVAESIEEDPGRLAELRGRRQLLRELRRKYGETLGDVMAYGEEARRRLEGLEDHHRRAAEIEGQLRLADEAVARAAAAVGAARRAAAPRLADAVTRRLAELAMPAARLEIAHDRGIEEDPAAEGVVFRLGANPGEPALPLAKVASGGELSRAMLALRLVLRDEDTATLVFDEVDAGIGGEAALAVGRALAALGRQPGSQILVVTHLAQVAAFADHQLAVTKQQRKGRTVVTVTRLGAAERTVELSRMLSGQPESAVARDHAEALLTLAASQRRGDVA